MVNRNQHLGFVSFFGHSYNEGSDTENIEGNTALQGALLEQEGSTNVPINATNSPLPLQFVSLKRCQGKQAHTSCNRTGRLKTARVLLAALVPS